MSAFIHSALPTQPAAQSPCTAGQSRNSATWQQGLLAPLQGKAAFLRTRGPRASHVSTSHTSDQLYNLLLHFVIRCTRGQVVQCTRGGHMCGGHTCGGHRTTCELVGVLLPRGAQGQSSDPQEKRVPTEPSHPLPLRQSFCGSDLALFLGHKVT